MTWSIGPPDPGNSMAPLLPTSLSPPSLQGAGIPVDFPSTFKRMKLGVRLSKAQVDNRCQQLDAWVQAAIRTPLTKTPAEQLSKFLNVRDPVLNNSTYVTLTARESR
mmetsp:Transcript_3631/g.7577  ORF Transcript_3631/g.7577 Transcript_3631/m.7577 type:complete len:107 (+) Transcript_3631:1526-1846(+)